MRRLQASFVLVFMLAVVCPASAERIALPEGLFYYQPAGSVFGAEATWVNPAGLAVYGQPSYQFMAEYSDGEYAKSWGGVSSASRLAFAYRKLYNPDGDDYKEQIYAAAFALGRHVYVGSSYRYFKEGPGIYHKKHFWNIGFVIRKSPIFSWGAVFSNLNRGRVDGERTETEQRYSLAYRPAGGKLTVSADMFLSTGTRLSNADYVYHVEGTPYPGLYLNAFIDSDKNFQIGFRANLLKYFVGERSSFSRDGDHYGTTVFAGGTSVRQPSLIRERGRRLSMSMSGRPAENPTQPVFGRKRQSFVSYLLTIYRAADDPSVSELIVNLNGLSLGFGQAQELRDALVYFKSRGKQVTCHIKTANNIAYYVASAADQILIPPVSQLNLIGLRAELTFYAGTLDKLGVKIDLMRIGEYKTAAETYTLREGTEENRRQINRILDDLYAQFVAGIADGRGIPADSMADIIDNGPFTSAEAIEYGLVDGLSYRDEVKKNFLTSLPEVSFRRYLTDTLQNDSWRRRPTLAVVVAEGEVSTNRRSTRPFSRPSDVTPRLMDRAFSQARRDSDVKGIVFRVNSPGGFALAGEDIYHSVERAGRRKPIVVSMGNVAASGGYYIAMPAEQLYACEGTITGSIGIYGGKADFSGLYDKLDLGKELYTRGRYAGMLSTIRPFTDDERAKYLSHLQAFYGHFLNLVAQNRQLPVDSIDVLARGRVWTGREAMKVGLVDQIGGLKDALNFAADRLELDEYDIRILPRKRTLIQLPAQPLFNLMAGLFSSDGDDILNQFDPDDFEGILARIPYDLTIE